MNMNRKSLGQILAGFELFSGLAGGKKATTETTTETKDETSDTTDADADPDKSEDKADETKTDGDAEKKAETGKVETTKEASALAGNVVSMSLEDYDKLVTMASLAIDATEENKGLKAKADRWDSYQAALGGGKPAADTAGAKADGAKADDTVIDEYADLRKKHSKLMDGI